MKKAKKSQNQQADSNADEEDTVSWLHQDKDKPPVKDSRENQSKQKPKQEDPDDEESVDKQPQIQFKRGQRVRPGIFIYYMYIVYNIEINENPCKIKFHVEFEKENRF